MASGISFEIEGRKLNRRERIAYLIGKMEAHLDERERTAKDETRLSNLSREYLNKLSCEGYRGEVA